MNQFAMIIRNSIIQIQYIQQYIHEYYKNQDYIYNQFSMTEKKPQQTALQKMQQIASKLISNTPQLSKILDDESVFKPKQSSPPSNKKNLNIAKSQTNKYNNIYPYSTISNKGQITSNQYHDQCKQLNIQLQVSKNNILLLEEQLKTIKLRFVEREIQYRKIIDELQDQLKCKTSQDPIHRNRMQIITDLHKQILDNIGIIQTKTSKILIEQQSDIRRFFHKKIEQIKDKYKQDRITKTQKDQQFIQKQKQLITQLQWIKNIAHKIDLQNQTIIKKYTCIKSQYQILQKDKNLLIKQLLTKKKQNSILKSQVQQYQTLLHQVSKQMEDNQIQKNVHLSNYIHQSKNQPQINHSKSNPNLAKNQNKKLSNITNSQITSIQNNNKNINQKFDKTINHLNSVIQKQKRRVRDLKTLYMKEIGSKSQLQKIVRKLVEDVRQSIMQVQRQRTIRKKSDGQLTQQARQKLLQQLLSNQKILTLIYDKTFYSGNRSPHSQQMPQALQKIMESNDEQGIN